MLTFYIYSPYGSHERVTIDPSRVESTETRQQRGVGSQYESVVVITMQSGVQHTVCDRPSEGRTVVDNIRRAQEAGPRASD